MARKFTSSSSQRFSRALNGLVAGPPFSAAFRAKAAYPNNTDSTTICFGSTTSYDYAHAIILQDWGSGNNQVKILRRDTSDNYTEAVNTSVIPDVWQAHVGVWYADGTARMYVDGVAGSLDSNVRALSNIDTIAIGAYLHNGSYWDYFCNDYVADMAIINGAASPAEITAFSRGRSALEVWGSRCIEVWDLGRGDGREVGRVRGTILTAAGTGIPIPIAGRPTAGDQELSAHLFVPAAGGNLITVGAGARSSGRGAATAALILSGRAYSFGGGRAQGAANLGALAAAIASGAARERASASLTVVGAARAQGGAQDYSGGRLDQSAAAAARGAATDRAATRLDQSAAAKGLAGAANRAAGKLDIVGGAAAQGGAETVTSGRLTILAAAVARGGGRSRVTAQLALLSAAVARSAGSAKAAATLMIAGAARSFAAGRNQAAWSIGSLIIAGAVAMGGGRARSTAQLAHSAAASSSSQATAAAAGRIGHSAAATTQGGARTRAGGRLDQVAAARSGGAGRAAGAAHLIISAAARGLAALFARAAVSALQFVFGQPEIVFRAPAVAAPFSALPAITLSAPPVARPFRAALAT